MKMDRTEAEAFFAELFGGAHHIPGKLKPFGEGWTVATNRDLATFDGDLLARAVVLAHERAIRFSVQPAGFYLRLGHHKRRHDGRSSFERHPTLAEALDGLGVEVS